MSSLLFTRKRKITLVSAAIAINLAVSIVITLLKQAEFHDRYGVYLSWGSLLFWFIAVPGSIFIIIFSILILLVVVKMLVKLIGLFIGR
jgi:hypothetical protein